MKSPLTRVLLILIAALTLLPLAGCEDRITQESYDKIKVGMSIDEVNTIMGGKGDLESAGMSGEISAGGIMTTQSAPPNIYKWQQGTKIITVTCKDGKVIATGKDGF